MATISDVAQVAGVAPSTVSRVLNGSQTVSRALRERVLEAVAEMNYRPNLLGRTLRTSRTNTVGFILPGLDAAPNIEAIQHAELNLQTAGYAMLIADTRGSADVELEVLRNLAGRRVDGVLCTPLNDPSTIIPILDESNTAGVFLFSRVIEATGRFATAVIDQRPGIDACARDLAESGHRRIAVVRRSHPFAEGAAYASRFAEALSGRGIEDFTLSEHVVNAAGSLMDLIPPVIRSLIVEETPPTALIVDVGSLPWVLATMRQLGRSPSDTSVVALGDSIWLDAMAPGINSIAVDVRVFISKASAALLALIHGGPLTEPVSEPSYYISRGSVHPR